MPKIQFGDYQNFLNEFYAGSYGPQRLGQAFCNKFQIGNDGFLFYERNEVEARMMIYKSKYVNFGE